MQEPIFEPRTSIGGELADWITADGWYRPDAIHFFPIGRATQDQFSEEEIRKHVLDGWLPKEPFISKQHLITSFGSCFAVNIENFLRKRGYTTAISKYGDPEANNYWSKSLLIKCSEAFVNTYSILYQLRWAFTGAEDDIRIWFKADGKVRRYIDSSRDATREMLTATDVFIITLGLSEVWYSKETGKVLWTGVPESEYDPDKYGFRLTTVQENRANLAECISLIRQHRGDVPIIVTLSPVPLNATYRPVSCITANSVSKAILRVAIDETMRAHEADKNVFYFPAFEVVTAYAEHAMSPDRMHPKHETIDAIMRAFRAFYCLD